MMLAIATLMAANSQVDEAMALANRLSPRLAQKVQFKQGKKKSTDYFTLSNNGDKVLITANNANSMAVGLNRYLKNIATPPFRGMPTSPLTSPKCFQQSMPPNQSMPVCQNASSSITAHSATLCRFSIGTTGSV